MKIKLSIICLCLLSFTTYSQHIKNLRIEKTEEKIRSAIKNKEVPSFALSISKNGKIIYEKAFGQSNLKKNKKATIHTSYQLASVTKPMTATAVVRLHQKGKIHLDSAINIYLPEFKFQKSDSSFSIPTIRQVLNHSSGLGTYFDIGYQDENYPFDDFNEGWKKYGTLFHQPGTVSEYSNLGYGLLDQLIEKISEKTFDEFMKEEIFLPLQMKDAFISPIKGKDIAKKYDSDQNELPEIINNTPGAGNIYCSIQDLNKFGVFHLKNLYQKNAPLTYDHIDLMHNYKAPKTIYHYYDSTYYGLGWYLKPDDHGYNVVWHEGGMMGASAMLKLIPEENISIAIITNTSNNNLCREITDDILKEMLPDYNPTPINETANYKHYTENPHILGKWSGHMQVDGQEISCSLTFQKDMIIMEYQDLTFKSYFTQGHPIPHKTILTFGIVNGNSFLGMFPGLLPSKDIRRKYSQFISLKLILKEDTLRGTAISAAAAAREYYSYPYAIVLKKEKI